MSKLQDLIPVTLGTFGNQTIPFASAKRLHAFLSIGRDFTSWVKGRIAQYGFVEGDDYLVIDSIGTGNDRFSPERGKTSKGGRPWIDYLITIDMGKELAMVERNEKGRQVRRYFIECERQVKVAAAMVPQTMPEALRLAADLADRLIKVEAKAKSDAPKVEFADLVAGIDKGIPIPNYAKAVGIGPLKLFEWMRINHILIAGGQRHNLPLQRYIESGYFAIRQGMYEANGELRASFTTMLTGKGEQWLTRLLIAAGMLGGGDDADAR